MTAKHVSSPGDIADVEEVAADSTAKLSLGNVTHETITCAAAGTDYAGAGAIPAGCRYVEFIAVNVALAQVDEVTSATAGAYLPAGHLVRRPVRLNATGDGKVHVQSPTAGTVVYVSYLMD